MDFENNTSNTAAQKRPYSGDSDDQPIFPSFLQNSNKLKKSKKSKKSKKLKKSKIPKKPKGEESAYEENAKDPDLPLELIQIGPFPSDYNSNQAEALSSLRQGATVAAFLLPNEAAAAPNEAMNQSIRLHQSTRHHLVPAASDRLKKLEETLGSNMPNGICTAPREFKGIPYVSMDNSYGSAATHEFHRTLSGIYLEMREDYRVHCDRQWFRNEVTPTEDAMRKKKFASWNFHREGQCHKENGLGSLAFICVSAGTRSVVTIRGPQPGGTVDWQKARPSDVDPATHKIIVWDFHVPKGRSAIILLKQNCWHGVAPYGQSMGSYAGFQTEEEY